MAELGKSISQSLIQAFLIEVHRYQSESLKVHLATQSVAYFSLLDRQ